MRSKSTRTRSGGLTAQAWLVPLGALVLLTVIVLAFGADARQRASLWLEPAGGPDDAETALVIDVIDGDTLVVAGGRTVRILGIDTPETHSPNVSGPQPFGAEATDRLADLVAGGRVRLERDVTEVDHYDRELRHVWAGDTLVAEQLLAEGLGHTLIIPPNARHADRLRAAEAEARAAGRGLWGMPRPTSLPIFGTPVEPGR